MLFLLDCDLTSAFRSERILTTHLLTAIWKVKLMTPLIFSSASSQRLLRVWHKQIQCVKFVQISESPYAAIKRVTVQVVWLRLPNHQARRSEAPPFWPVCSLRPGKTELFFCTRRTLPPVRPPRCWSSAGSRRSQRLAASSRLATCP